MASSTAVPCVLLTRKGSQVQTLSRPPPLWLVRALSGPGRQPSSRAAAALLPRSAPRRTGWALRDRRHRTITSPTTTERGHHPLCPAHGRAPCRQPAQDAPAGGTGEHLLVLVLSSQPTVVNDGRKLTP